ncbi:MAG: DnaA regulatory inactivator Hda [Pseudomonadales bacterium]
MIRPGATPTQLTLAFPLRPRSRFEQFVSGQNQELLERLEALAAHQGSFAGCYLTGAQGSGKTHLLQAACQRAGTLGRRAMYLPLSDPALDPESLDGLERMALVALDDVHTWLGSPARERALLGLYQGLLQQGATLLVAAPVAAAALQCRFADLCSRLRALDGYQLRPLDDGGKQRLLAELAANRGLTLAAEVLDFWLTRGSRDLPTLLAQLDALDAASLAAQRRVTVPLLKQVLGL